MSDEPTNQLRYVVLQHDGVVEPHFDLMFETAPGSTLTTWRASRWPVGVGDVLTKLSEHRREYLDYEGSVSGNRGSVTRVRQGTAQLAHDDPTTFRTRIDNVLDLTFAKSTVDDTWRCTGATGSLGA